MSYLDGTDTSKAFRGFIGYKNVGYYSVSVTGNSNPCLILFQTIGLNIYNCTYNDILFILIGIILSIQMLIYERARVILKSIFISFKYNSENFNYTINK